MPDWPVILESAGLSLGYLAVILLCLAGVVLSCITLSGTWLVALAALLAAWLSGAAFPGPWTVILFLLISLAVESLEWMAGAWGVSRRGGSKLAGLAAMLGGLAGMLAGAVIPPPIVGSLLGMVGGGFAAAYWVEKRRLQKADHALHIAWGTVVARVAVLFLKVSATLGMILWLVLGRVLM